jgi:hypothetical protein
MEIRKTTRLVTKAVQRMRAYLSFLKKRMRKAPTKGRKVIQVR